METKCKICNHTNMAEISDMLAEGITYSKICDKFPDLNQMNCSTHKKHMTGDTPEKLQELIHKALHSDIQIENIADLVKLLDHQKRFTDCESCKFKSKGSGKTIETALSEFLGVGKESDSIYITPEENELFIAWLRTLPEENELRKSYQSYDYKIKEQK
jgi:hypothetical protein